MGINIKNPEAERLARELAALRGTTLVSAITEAVQERLNREKAARQDSAPGETRLEWLARLTAYTAPRLKDLPPSDQIGDLLYDKKTGMPL
jgi:antitoxin VapB